MTGMVEVALYYDDSLCTTTVYSHLTPSLLKDVKR